MEKRLKKLCRSWLKLNVFNPVLGQKHWNKKKKPAFLDRCFGKTCIHLYLRCTKKVYLLLNVTKITKVNTITFYANKVVSCLKFIHRISAQGSTGSKTGMPTTLFPEKQGNGKERMSLDRFPLKVCTLVKNVIGIEIPNKEFCPVTVYYRKYPPRDMIYFT